ncbi:MAG: aspartate kinase [Gemmataceae bacterium]|nr:aspartate kinase [Gemmataceae bacterium]
MPLVVQKFGGSSVATAARIMAAARRAIRARQAGCQVIVVVSARGDTTDELIGLAHEITDDPPKREMDMLLATGEQISIALMAMAIRTLGVPAISFTGTQIGIRTDSTHTKARIKEIDTARIRQALAEGNVVIVAGFQGVDEEFNITTLGRGGSDTTAVALAAVLKHESDSQPPVDHPVNCEIYTDVDGVYTTDPRVVPEARKLDAISYDEMLELASVGAGVMHSRSIEFAKKFDVPLMVRSSFTDTEGTWIVPEAAWMRDVDVCGAAMVRDEAGVFIEQLPDRPGISHTIFAALAEKNIVVDMIVQNVAAAGKAGIGFTVPKGELAHALAILQPHAASLGARITADEEVSKVSVVGTGMRTHSGVAGKMFAALAAEQVNMKMITTGDIKISVLVDKADGARALRAVHEAFRLERERPGAGRPAPESARGAQSIAVSGGDLAVGVARLTAMEDILVRDVVLDDNHGRVTVTDLPDEPGVCARLFSDIAGAGVLVDMIVQNLTRDGRAVMSFSVPANDLTRAVDLTKNAVVKIHDSTAVSGDIDLAVLHVYGVGMRTHTGVARTMFGALAAQGINIAMINTSEVCVSVAVDKARGKAAHAALRTAFALA